MTDLETRLDRALRKDARKTRKAEADECDRCSCKMVGMATCPHCGKTFRRCGEHDGEDGARRSLGSHKGLNHPKGDQ